MNTNIDRVIRILESKSYSIAEIPYTDEFGRIRIIAKNKKRQKVFVKTNVGKNSYSYSSLLKQARLSLFLSRRADALPTFYNGYRLLIPKVEEIIEEDNCIIFISHFIEGTSLLDLKSEEQAAKIIVAYSLVNSLDVKRHELIPFQSKDYSQLNILLETPLRFVQAFFRHPKYTAKLLFATMRVLPLAFESKLGYGLVHSDINASNIILDKKDIYLVDWEEAGWGLKLYNEVAPLCCHWTDSTIRKIIYSNLKKGKNYKAVVPLIAFRTLTLFNQKITPGNKKHWRDVQLLNSL